jgi:hypothetical protein
MGETETDQSPNEPHQQACNRRCQPSITTGLGIRSLHSVNEATLLFAIACDGGGTMGKRSILSTLLISLVIAVVAIISVFTFIYVISNIAFRVAVAGYFLLLIGVMSFAFK